MAKNALKNFELTILVPIYNEAENIERLTTSLLAFIPKSLVKTEVLFIDDGSTDSSLELLEDVCEHHTDLNFISLSTNTGLSAAIKAGFDQTKTNLVGYIDADLQTTPLDFNHLLKHIPQFDLVTGIRNKRDDRTVKRWSSKIANAIRRSFTKDGIEDTGCPLKILKTEYAQRIPMFKGLHRFLPAMILLQNGTIKAIPVQHFPRIAGDSKFGFFNRLWGPLTDCFAFLWMKKKYINYTISKHS